MEALLQSNWSTEDSASAQSPANLVGKPYRRLAAAVINEALNSIANPSHLPALYPQASEECLKRRRATDLRWFESDRQRSPLPNYLMLSFAECCSILDIDHRRLRREMRDRGWLDGTARFSPRDINKALESSSKAESHG